MFAQLEILSFRKVAKFVLKLVMVIFSFRHLHCTLTTNLIFATISKDSAEKKRVSAATLKARERKKKILYPYI